MKITVIGVGYVGLVSAVGFAEMGNEVTCLLREREKLAKLRRGQPTIYEPGLEALLRRNVREGRIAFTLGKALAIRGAEVIVIAVGTPEGADGRADLSAVLSVARDIGRLIIRPVIVVTKSTVPVGTGDRLKREITAAMGRRKVKFSVASNPEFLREGAAVKDFLAPDRVVVGVDDDRTGRRLTELYQPITQVERPLVLTDVRSAELIKYASNCFLATKISFINDIANLCELTGADVVQVARGMGLDERIGPRFLQAGVGYGGSCFPKDVSALRHLARDLNHPLRILEAASAINREQRDRVFAKLVRLVPTLRNRTVAVWGLSFKPRTDDVRDAPALDLIARVLAAGGRVQAYDPEATVQAKRQLKPNRRLRYASSADDALRGADALLLMTEWDEFRQPDFRRMKRLMSGDAIIDGRNIFSPAAVRSAGLRYQCVGRGRPTDQAGRRRSTRA